MYLTKHQTVKGPCWALDGEQLPYGLGLDALLTLPRSSLLRLLQSFTDGAIAEGKLLPPIEPNHEVWGSGVTYLRSREARKAESDAGDVYEKVYDAERPEIFFKASGWRAVGSGGEIRVRADTSWNVPEPELTLVINAHQEIIGYTVGDDVSSRDIEGENPLYLPQAKSYNGSCAIGPGIQIANEDELVTLSIELEIEREGQLEFEGKTSTSSMKRTFPELAEYLFRELDFPYGAYLMTGTGVVPPDEFTLRSGDIVRVSIGGHTLENSVA